MNYTRIGYPPAAARVPADEEIWGEDLYLEEIAGSSPKDLIP
jgi:hypothetical protein